MSKCKRWFAYILLAGMIPFLFMHSTIISADEEPIELPVTETIYWGITNHILTLSDSEVEGDIKNSFSSRASITTSDSSWYTSTEKPTIQKVVVQDYILPVNISYWFYGFSKCTTFELQNLDTRHTVNMSNLFENCESVVSLDITHFDTTNVTNMSYMFNNCSKLTTIDVRSFNTTNVTTTQSMFYRCAKLAAIDVSHFDTANVTNMRFMFYGCRELLDLDISVFEINEDCIVNGMLGNLTILKKISLSESIISLLSRTNLAYNWYKEDLTEFTSSNPICEAGTYYKKCTVTFYGYDVQIVGKKDCLFNTTVDPSDIDIPKNAGYLFEKWVTTRNGSIPFDFTSPITSDVSIYSGFAICAHEYGEWEITRQTACDLAGSKHRFCSKCNYEDIESIPSPDHVLSELYEGIDPTCTEVGREEYYYCSSCQKYYDAELVYLPTIVIPALGHSYNEAVVWDWNDAFDEAHVTLTCDVCSHQEVLEAEVEEDILKSASCIETGSKKLTASIEFENRIFSEEKTVEIPMEEHLYGVWIPTIPAGCLKEGALAHYHCSTCKKDFNEKYEEFQIQIAALGHNYQETWTIDTDATCEAEGSKSHHCSRCDSKIDITTIEALGHAYGDWEVTLAPTCTEAGKEEKICAHDATHRESRELAALGHSYGDWKVTVAATCTEAGREEKTCTHDETHKESRELAALGHQFSSGWSYDEENHYHSCKNCSEKQSVGSHEYGDWEVVREATNFMEGLEAKECSICGHRETKTIPMIRTAKGLSVGAIVGISLGSFIGVLLIVYIGVYFFVYKKNKLQYKVFHTIYWPMNKLFK